MSVPRVPPIERLRARLVVDPNTGCQNWTGAKNPKGYGRIGDGKRLRLQPHRVAYEAAKGPIPAGLVIDHLCRNPSCCNPDHLEAVTSAENTRRGRSGLKDARKTHCPSGHPYDAANTYLNSAGHRHCRACMAARGKQRDWAAQYARLKGRDPLLNRELEPHTVSEVDEKR